MVDDSVTDDPETGPRTSTESILNADEIADLLAGDQGHPGGIKGTSILTGSHKLSYERLPMLEVVMDRLVRFLSTTLRNFTSDTVEISLEKMQAVRFGDYIGALSVPTLLGVVKINEWASTILLAVDAPLIYNIVEVLLGGRGQPSLIEDRPFTSIECHLVERLINVILNDFSKSFEAVAPLHFHLERLETNPHFVSIVRPANASVLATLTINMEGRGGKIDILLPYESLEPGRHKLLQMFMGEKFGQDNIWANHFSHEVWKASVTMEAILDNVTIPLKEVLGWKPGSQLSLKAQSDSVIAIKCGNTLVCNGKMGKKNGNVSVKVEENFIIQRKLS